MYIVDSNGLNYDRKEQGVILHYSQYLIEIWSLCCHQPEPNGLLLENFNWQLARAILLHQSVFQVLCDRIFLYSLDKICHQLKMLHHTSDEIFLIQIKSLKICLNILHQHPFVWFAYRHKLYTVPGRIKNKSFFFLSL